MDNIQALVLGAVQGLTEFLPISSSAHLILISHWMGWPDQGLFFDVWLHLATLLAVILFFLKPLWIHYSQRQPRPDTLTLPPYFLFKLALSCIPVALAGALAHHWVQTIRSPQFIALTSLGFCATLWLSLVLAKEKKSFEQWSWADAWWLGCFQALAILPGASRAGMTLTGAFLLGYRCPAAIWLTLLLGIPTIAMAESFELFMLLWHQVDIVFSYAHGLGFLSSFIIALICLKYLVQLRSRWQLWPFVAYRLLLGLTLYAQVHAWSGA